MKEGKIKRFLQLICLSVGATVIYFVPIHLRSLFYVPMQEVFGYTNTQIGNLAGWYGIMTIVTYLPGGWLADKYSARKLLAGSYIITGLLTLVMALYPPYEVALWIFILVGISSTLTFWAALLKLTRQFGKDKNQGKAFGSLEGGRGLAATIIFAASSVLFSRIGNAWVGLRILIVVFGVGTILVAVMTLLVFDEKDADHQAANVFHGFLRCLKNLNTWLIAFIVMGIYTVHAISQYIAPFATNAFGTSVLIGSLLSQSKQWVKPLAGIGGGILADRFGVSKILLIGSVLLATSVGVFAWIPGNSQLFWLLIINTVIIFLLLGLLRGLYFADLNEAGIEWHLTGTVIGFATTIGMLGDVFVPFLAGRLLDYFPADKGYTYIFGMGVVSSCFAVIMLLIFRKYNKQRIEDKE